MRTFFYFDFTKVNLIQKIKRFLVLCVFLFGGSLSATYTSVYSINTNGGIAYTGNTLGLNKEANQNNPGTSGSIGAFITLNSLSQVNTYPFGTTLTWASNSSSAVLDLPPGTSILHAELVWSGSYGFDPAITNNDNLSPSFTTNTPISFTTPSSGPITITPTLAKSRVNSGSNGFYVRSADVTSLVAAAGAGTYTVGGVPATVIATENNLNCAGWTLCVAYANPNMLTSNLTLFVGCEASGAAPAFVTGFHAPDLGSISGRLFVSSLEGDAQITGDRFLVNENTPLVSPADQISGTNNPATNFFGSQINTLLTLSTDILTGKLIASGSSVLDTRGTFGTINSNAATGTGISGARQGYDITSIDIGSLIQNSQEQIYTQGTTTGDVYTINALGIQLQVKAPSIKSIKSASSTTATVGDVITFTITFENVGELLAESLNFTDILPTGMTLVSNSLYVNNVLVPSPNLITGVPLGDLAVNATTTVVFDVDVNSPQQSSYTNFADVTYTFTPEGTNPPPSTSILSRTNENTLLGPSVTPPIANNNSGQTSANTILNGTSVLINDSGVSIHVSVYDNTSTQGGSVFMNWDGTYTYTPPTGFSGADSFTYTIIDANNQTATATVNITVLPVALGNTATVASNTLLSATTVLSNDIGTGLTATPIVNGSSDQGGTVNMQADGTYTYTSALNFSGVDTFSYTVTDSNSQSTTAIVTITVLPVAKDDTGLTSANTSLAGSTVFTNDVGQGLVITTYDNVSNQGGTVLMNTIDGTYTYTPALNFSGIDTFKYTVKDAQGNLTVATVTITVLPVSFNDNATGNVNTLLNGTTVLSNDAGTGLFVPPFIGSTIQGGSVTMYSDGTYTYQPPTNFSGSDSFTYTAQDATGNQTTAKVFITILPDADNLTATTNANTPLTGSSVLSNASGSALTVISFQNPSSQGGQVSMNANGTYSYIPPLNFSGTDTFQFTIKDSEGNTDTATVTITVLPIGSNDNVQTPVNTPLIGRSVLENDIGTGLQIVTYDTTSVNGGTVSMNTDGTFVYIPPANFTGVDSFTYTAQDGDGNSFQRTVFITVTQLLPPENFTGILKTCKLLNKKQYSVVAKWNPSPSPSVVAYRIYLDGKLIKEIPSAEPLKYTVCLKSKNSAYTIKINAIDALKSESVFETIRIIP